MASQSLKKNNYNEDPSGIISVLLRKGEHFNALGAELTGYDPDKYQLMALRVYLRNTTTITAYVIQKEDLKKVRKKDKKKSIRKFKKEISLKKFLSYINSCDFTLVNGNYNIENMDLILNS